MFLDCPAWLDQEGDARCGLPAEVRSWFTMRSSAGPVESVMIRCPVGHCFNGPVEVLTLESRHKHEPGHAAVRSSPLCDGLTGSHDGPDREAGSAARGLPRDPDREISRLTSAPAYYLGRPARVWITAMSPRREVAVHG
jgi:hypothetical protein